MNVAILCTGKMELLGLAPALKTLFPEHEFVTVGKVETMPGLDAEPLPEFASKRIDDNDALDPVSVLRKRIVPEVAGALDAGYHQVILVADLELENMGRAPHVCDIVKHAVRLHVQGIDPRYAAVTERAFRERASFHLSVPMTESWLFGDPSVCEKNNVPPGRTPRLTVGRDREAFLTSDPEYEIDHGTECATLVERAARGVKRKRAPWVKERRTEHPKHYLEWLCRDPAENDCTTWKETKAGANALACLDWKAVLNLPSEYGFLHALVEDLADALKEPEPFAPAVRLDVPTRLRPPSQRTYLRNECDYHAFEAVSDP